MKKAWFGFMSFSLAFFAFFSLVWVFTNSVALWPWRWKDQFDSPSAIESFLCTSKSFCWFCFQRQRHVQVPTKDHRVAATSCTSSNEGSSHSSNIMYKFQRTLTCPTPPHPTPTHPTPPHQLHVQGHMNGNKTTSCTSSNEGSTRSRNIMYKFQRRIIA